MVEENNGERALSFDLYEGQEDIFEEKKKISSQKIPGTGVLFFFVGVFIVYLAFWFGIDHRVLNMYFYLFILISFIPFTLGAFILRRRISVLKPIIAGSILLIFGGVIIMNALILSVKGISHIETYGFFLSVCSTIYYVLGIPALVGGVCAIIRKKYVLTLIGGIISIFLGGLIFGVIGVILCGIAIILLLLSANEFDD